MGDGIEMADEVEVEAKPVSRKGRVQLLDEHDWVEFSVHPHGKRVAIPRWSVQGIVERVDDGGATITVQVGQAATNVPLLDLYLPALRKILSTPNTEAE